MNRIVAFVGGFITASGVIGIIFPHLMLDWVMAWPADVRFYVTVGARLVLGLLFILSAPGCRWPRFVTVIGVIALVAAVTYLLMGQARLDALITWADSFSMLSMRLIYAAAAVFGTVLAYSSLKPHS